MALISERYQKLYEFNIYFLGDDILKLSEILDEQELNDCEIILRKSFPNTYTYTKAIAEQVVQQYAKEIPTGIFRPGISKNH